MTTADKKEPDEYNTRSLALAAFLSLEGCALLRTKDETRGNNIKRTVFVFSDKAKCKKLAFSYNETDFAKFYSKVQDFKRLIFE